MRAQKQIALILILFLIVIGGVVFVGAEPPMPCAFYGNFTHINQTFPNGHFLIAKINGVVSGECPIVDQKFGDSGSCVLISYEDNVPVEFYLEDKKIGESTFNEMERVNIDLTVDFIPKIVHVPSNGICEIELDECSYNILDCNVIVSDVCIGNGICEPYLGETCQNSPEDCGPCSSNEGTSSGGSSSGSSGGGGGGLSSSTAGPDNSSEENETETSQLGTYSSDLNEQEDISVDQKPRRGISGWSIFGGNSSSENEFKSWIWITIILLILFFYLIKKSQKEKKKKFDKKFKESMKKYNPNGKKRTIKKAPPRRK
jgi:uncharacterized membrane protein YgcG